MPENNGNLAEAVKAHIQSKGWSQTTIAARGGPSTTSLTKITSGRGNLSPKMLAQIDAGMQWGEGRAAQILAGEVPGAVDLAQLSDDALLAEVRRRMKGAPSWLVADRPEEELGAVLAEEAIPIGEDAPPSGPAAGPPAQSGDRERRPRR